MQLIYFAKIRETIGRGEENVEFPASIKTVADAVNWLSQLGPEYAAAFASRDRLRFALDQVMATPDTAIDTAKELAIFPPVTGG
jgi:sulfur-carrier protein